jgi:hypothetical protein
MNPWTSFLQATRFGLDVQSVIALRLMRIAAGGALGFREVNRMVMEKTASALQAQTAAATALAFGGGPKKAAKRATGVYRRAVMRNRNRLVRAKPRRRRKD